MATPALVPGPIGTLGRSAGPSSSAQESARSAALPPSSSEPSRAQPDWVSHCQLSARHFGFSAEMARQLALCRRSLTCLNYQSKWNTYRAWCHSHGHSISQPSVSKVADFLLYLRRSLHLSYSSIASYRSMLSAAFHFVLPKLSSLPVLHDLLHSFSIDCPLPSSHLPPWDLLKVLSLLRGPPFEPLSSCYLHDLTRKVLFLLSLATTCRVGKLQAVLSSVSSSGNDLFLSYLLEFHSKSESSTNPLPRSFHVRSLRDVLGSLPEELLPCPVRELRFYLIALLPYLLVCGLFSFLLALLLVLCPRMP